MTALLDLRSVHIFDMPVLHIHCKSGKSDDVKRAIVKEISDTFVRHLQIPPEWVETFWHDIDDNNFSRGGKLLVDILKEEKK